MFVIASVVSYNELMAVITSTREDSLSLLRIPREERIQITSELQARIGKWHALLRSAALDLLKETGNSVEFSLTKTRYLDVLACEKYALTLYQKKEEEPSAESDEIILGHLVDALVIERVTLESGFNRDLGCFPLPRLPNRSGSKNGHDQDRDLLDLPTSSEESWGLTKEEIDAVFDHAQELYLALGDGPEELRPENRTNLASKLVQAAANIAQNFPLLTGPFMPRTQKSYRIVLSPPGEPEIALSGRVDLLIGNPPRERASTCMLDVKSGGISEDHRKENYFYALLETLATGAPPFQVGTYYSNSGAFEVESVNETLLDRTVGTVCKALKTFGELLASENPRNPKRNGQFRCYWCKFNDSCPASLTSGRQATGALGEDEDANSHPEDAPSVEAPDSEEKLLAGSGTSALLDHRKATAGSEDPKDHSTGPFPLARKAVLEACLNGSGPGVVGASQGSRASIQRAEMNELRKDCKQRIDGILERLGQHLGSSLPAPQAGGTRLLTEWDFQLILEDRTREAKKFLNPEPSSFVWSPRMAKRGLSWHCLAQIVNADKQDLDDTPPNAPENLPGSVVQLSKCAFPTSLFEHEELGRAPSTGAESPDLSFPTPSRQTVLNWLEQSASEPERIASAAFAHTLAADLWHLVDFGALKASGARLAFDGNPKNSYYSPERTAPVKLRARWFLEVMLPQSNESSPSGFRPRNVIVDSTTRPTTGRQFRSYELEGGFISLLHLLKKGYLPERIVYLCPSAGSSHVVEVDKGLLARTIDVLEGFADEVDRQAGL